MPAYKKVGSTRWLGRLVVLLLLVGGGVAGFEYWRHHRAADSAGAGRGDAKDRPVPVVARPVKKSDFPVYLNGLGTVTALNSVTVRSRVDGQLDTIAFHEGQFVHAGDLIAQIDPRPFQVQLDQARGQLAKDQAALQNSQVELQRDQAAADAIPRQQIDTQKATVDQNAGAVKVDQGQIENAELQLTYARITAPISGQIGLRVVDQGNIVHATDTAGVAVITQLQPIAVIFSLSQDNLAPIIRRGDRGVGLTVDAFDRDFKNKLASGKVEAIDNQVDAATGTIRLKATFANEDGALFSNQFVNARLLVDTLSAAIVAPAAAVQRGPDSVFVYVVKQDKTVEVRPVQIGPTEADQTVIAQGLAPGEVVVTDGLEKLQEGSKVTLGDNDHRGAGPTTSSATSQPAQHHRKASDGGGA